MQGNPRYRGGAQPARARWAALVMVWAFSVAATFLLPLTPGFTKGADKLWLRSAMLVLVVVGLVVATVSPVGSTERASQSRRSALLCLVLGALCLFCYKWLELAWTVRNSLGKPVVIGSTYTYKYWEFQKSFKQAHPGEAITPELLVRIFIKPEYVWTRSSIDRHRLALTLPAMTWLPLIAMGIARLARPIAGVPPLPLAADVEMTKRSPASREPVELFYSYSHRDEKLRAKLETHLALLQHEGLISAWHDRKITAGSKWSGEIDEHLHGALIILLLVSADFLASGYCYDVEMQQAMKQNDAGKARVIPVILRDVDWSSALFGKLQALPTDGKAVTGRAWKNQDEAFRDVARGIRTAVEEQRSRREQS